MNRLNKTTDSFNQHTVVMDLLSTCLVGSSQLEGLLGVPTLTNARPVSDNRHR